MSDKNKHIEFSQRRELQSAGWRVEQSDKIEFNHGSETAKHIQTKVAAAIVLQEKGYRIDSEVEMGSGTVDLLGYGREDGDVIVVEAETSPTEEVIEDKIERYIYNEPPRECYVLNTNDIPTDFIQSIEWVREQL